MTNEFYSRWPQHRLDAEVIRDSILAVSGTINLQLDGPSVPVMKDAVGQVVVIGVPDEQWGEAVKAVVVLKPGVEAGDQLVSAMQDLVKQAQGSVQSPKTIDFVDAIPLTPVGKPDKKAVRALYWEGSERGVG